MEVASMELAEQQETERRILRKIVKDMFVREGRLLPQNEFNRRVCELAKKFGEEPEAVREVITPILTEIFTEMIEPSRSATGVSFEEMADLTTKGSERKSSLPGGAFRSEK